MHHLLERQRKKVFNEQFPPSPELEAFLRVVSATYDSYDQDRKLLEHSFDVSSREFLELHNRVLKLLEELKVEKENIEQKVVERTHELNRNVEELNQSNQLLIKKEEELIRANERLSELDKVKTEFISVAAHQLRTPLSAIKWTLSLLIDENSENLTTEQRSLLLKGYESNERTINLINKMLVVTRIESGKMEYDLAFIHIEDLIDATLLDFAGDVETHHIRLEFQKPDTVLPYIHADPGKIRAVIQSLVENALAYTNDGGTVTLSATREGTFIRVSVQDNGIGIPAHQQHGIFNKFFRADNAVKAKTDGSGLGLFVAKNIVDRHGGTIGFESTEHIGTTFYFTLPVAPHV